MTKEEILKLSKEASSEIQTEPCIDAVNYRAGYMTGFEDAEFALSQQPDTNKEMSLEFGRWLVISKYRLPTYEPELWFDEKGAYYTNAQLWDKFLSQRQNKPNEKL